MKNARIHASVDEIAKSLQGNWRAEHLFALKQSVDAFDFIGTQLAECDREIDRQLHVCRPTKVNLSKVSSAGARAMRRNSICARSCSKCVVWI